MDGGAGIVVLASVGAVAEVGVEVPPHGEQHVEAAGTVNTVEAHHEKEGGGTGITVLASVGAVAEVGVEVPPHGEQHVEAAGTVNTVEAYHEKEGGGAGIIVLASVGAVAEVGVEVNTVEAYHKEEGGGAGIVVWASVVAPHSEQRGAAMMTPMKLVLSEKYFGARIAMMPKSAQHRHHPHHMMGMRMGPSGRPDVG
jgi:hypothetical protein